MSPAPTVRQPASHVRAHARLADIDTLAAARCRVPAPTWSPLLPRCFPATTGHAPRSSSGLSASSLNVPSDINVFIFDITMVNNSFTSAARILPFKTQVEHSQPSAPATNHPIEGEVAFCVRGVNSPLLSNLVLDELDRELERRGHRFVRYADDCNIYVRSERAGQRVMESITHFLTQKLKLKVNEAKSAVARPQERKFLGFSFSAGPDIKRTIAPKSLERFKQRIRDITRGAKGVSVKATMEELARYMLGWRGYFDFCETPEVLIALTRWVRLRLRAALWRQWKTPRRRRAALIANGVSEWAARKPAAGGRGPWYLARSRALSTGLSNAYFKSLGLPSLFQSC